MKRKKKLYARPKKAYELGRIKEENVLVKKYGLKNKREIWKTIAKVKYFRERAKALSKAPREEQEVLFGKLNAIGLKISTISDVLDLEVESLLRRRLPTIVAKKGFAKTPQEARQMVVHKRVIVNGRIVDAPSYIVSVVEENDIKIKVKPKAKAEAPKEAESEVQEQTQEVSQ